MNDQTATAIFKDIIDQPALKSWSEIGGYRAVDNEVADHCRDVALAGISLDNIEALSLQQLTLAVALCTKDIGLKKIWCELKRRRNELDAREAYPDAPIPVAIRSIKHLITCRRWQLKRSRTTERVVRDLSESLRDLALDVERDFENNTKLI